jgi:hypothetical protein
MVSTISVGCIVACKDTQAVLYRVVARAGDRWILKSLREDREQRLVDEQDLVLILSAMREMLSNDPRFVESTDDAIAYVICGYRPPA